MPTFSVPFHFDVRPGLLSVVIPAYRDVAGLTRTLESLRDGAGCLSRFDVVVANDGGDLAVSNVCKAFKVAEVQVVPQGGSYVARNRALAVTKGALIAFLDSDVTVDRNWFAAMCGSLKKADYVAGSVRIVPNEATDVGRLLDLKTAFPVEKYLAQDGYGVTANLGVHRRVIERFGGFDERLRSGGDLEFGSRLRDCGVTQLFAEDAIVYHSPRSFREQLAKLRRTAGGTALLALHYPMRFARLRPRLLGTLRYLLPPSPVWLRRLSAEGWETGLTLYAAMWVKRLYTAQLNLAFLITAKGRKGPPMTAEQ